MTFKQRILCCVNNRAAVADVYSLQTFQTLKPKALNIARAQSISSSTFEEPVLLETVLPKRTLVEKEKLSPERSVFRESSIMSEELEDMLTLKRANPVYDSDDDDEFCTPSKRQRRVTNDDEEERDDAPEKSQEPIHLLWRDQVLEDEDEGFLILSPNMVGARAG